jgi:hypothetical protein
MRIFGDPTDFSRLCGAVSRRTLALGGDEDHLFEAYFSFRCNSIPVSIFGFGPFFGTYQHQTSIDGSPDTAMER